MSYLRDNSNIIKGDQLWLFIGENKGFEYPTCFAQQHSLTRSLSTTSVSSKDHGNTSYVIPGEGSWTCSTEALMSFESTGNGAAFTSIMDLYNKSKIVYVKFGKLSNYVESGIVNVDTTNLPASTQSGWQMDYPYWEGQGYITSLQASGGHGDSATFSIEITGVGPLKKVENPFHTITLINTPALEGHITVDKQSAMPGETVTITNDGTYDDDQIILQSYVFDYVSLHTWTFVMPNEDVFITTLLKYAVSLEGADKSNFSFTENEHIETVKVLPSRHVCVYPSDQSFLTSYMMVSNINLTFDSSSNSYWECEIPDLYGTAYTYVAITPTQTQL